MQMLNFQLENKKSNYPMNDRETYIFNVVFNLEVRRHQAMLSKDVKFLDRVFAQEMHYMHSNSTADSKEEYIAKISNGKLAYLSISATDVDIRVNGSYALVLGHLCAEVVSDGKPRILDCKYIAVWGLEGETWRFKAFAPTPVPKAI